MSLEEMLVKHLAPRLEATKVVSYRYHGRVTRYPHPEWNVELEALKLALQLQVPCRMSDPAETGKLQNELS